MIDRRTMLAAGGAVAITGLAPALPRLGRPALAAGEVPTAQVVGAQRRRVGDQVVTALSDGFLALGPDIVPNASAQELRPLFERAFLDMDSFRGAVNAYLVDRADRRVLIDAGGETAGFPSLGRLDENLAAIGVDPASVDALVVTHLHPDHIGGAITADGAAAFPNAEMIVPEAEAAFWRDDANVNDGNRAFFELARRALDAYEGRGALTLFSGETEVVPGIRSRALPGHTPGHTGYVVGTGADALLVWGDIVHIPPVQFAAPQYYVGFDVNPEQAVQTRRAIMAELASERLAVAGMHLLFPGFGHVARGESETAYRFVEAPFQYEL